MIVSISTSLGASEASTGHPWCGITLFTMALCVPEQVWLRHSEMSSHPLVSGKLALAGEELGDR